MNDNKKIEQGSAANEGAIATKTQSDVGKVKNRGTSLDAVAASVPSGKSSIDPGGSYGGKNSSDQD